MFTVEEIKDKFPNPIKCVSSMRQNTYEKYCVGGAFCLYAFEHGTYPYYAFETASQPFSFPGPSELGDYLRASNPTLTREVAYNFATNLIIENDAERFSGAWDILVEALAWRPSTEEAECLP